MEIEVHLFANLADYGSPGPGGAPPRVELPASATVRDLLRQLRIPDEVPCILLVNGHDVVPTARLNRGDVVDILPPLVGG